jgi:hypothetical protein
VPYESRAGVQVNGRVFTAGAELRHAAHRPISNSMSACRATRVYPSCRPPTCGMAMARARHTRRGRRTPRSADHPEPWRRFPAPFAAGLTSSRRGKCEGGALSTGCAALHPWLPAIAPAGLGVDGRFRRPQGSVARPGEEWRARRKHCSRAVAHTPDGGRRRPAGRRGHRERPGPMTSLRDVKGRRSPTATTDGRRRA